MSENKFTPEEEEQIKKAFDKLDQLQKKWIPEEYRSYVKFWKLDENKNPIPATSYEFDFQCRNFEKCKRVDLTHIGPYIVSTVFLAIDHGFGPSSAPILFETMIWNEKTSEHKFFEHQWRYHTWQEAINGHRAVVKLIKEGALP